MSGMFLAARPHDATQTSWLFLGGAVLVTAVALAVLLAARRFGWLPRPTPEISHLSRDDQRLVLRAVQRGETAPNPALAGAAVANARRARRRSAVFVEGRGWTVLMYGLVGLFLLLTVFDLAGSDRDLGGAALHLALAGVWAANPYLHQRQLRLARRAEQLNLKLLNQDLPTEAAVPDRPG